MSISPSTDLIMDVARAADPQRAAAATQKLVSNARQDGAKNFAGLLEIGASPSVKSSQSQDAVTSAILERLNGRQNPASAATSNPVAKAYQSLGALMLQKSIEGMMPKSDKSLFSAGSAGGIWNAMLAEHMAAKAAASSFHLPERLKTHAIPAVSQTDSSISQTMALS